jgi:hypothetical protein
LFVFRLIAEMAQNRPEFIIAVLFVYLPDRPTSVYDQPGMRLPVPEFAKDFNLTVEGLFSCLME